MSNVLRIRLFVGLLVLGMFAAACGQKEGVHNLTLAQGGGGGATIPPGEEFVDEDGDGLDDSTNLGADAFVASGGGGGGAVPGAGGGGGGGAVPGAGGGGGGAVPGAGGGGGGAVPGAGGGGGGGDAPGGGGGGDAPGGGGGGGGGGGEQPPANQPPPAGDSTGVTASEIRIGIHAPITGASPLPPDEFESGKEQYWRARGPVQGRTVRVFVKDDTYNPSTASRVCKELIQEDKVFILVGGGGADQVRTCAIVAAQAGVPYVSAGVDEGVLRQLPNYFALSYSYPQQAPLLVQYIANVLKPSKSKSIGLLYDRTPSFRPALDKFRSAARSAGYTIKEVPYSGNASLDGEKLRGLDVVFPIMAPADFVQVAISAGGRTVKTYTGMGITMGLNTVTGAICRANSSYDGQFFSPFPGLDKIGQMDPKFGQAGGRGDIELALWGLNKTIDGAFTKMGSNLTRQSFLQAMTGTIKTGVYPTLNHSQSNHFGATSAHVLQSNCSTGKNDTRFTFKSGF